MYGTESDSTRFPVNKQDKSLKTHYLKILKSMRVSRIVRAELSSFAMQTLYVYTQCNL